MSPAISLKERVGQRPCGPGELAQDFDLVLAGGDDQGQVRGEVGGDLEPVAFRAGAGLQRIVEDGAGDAPGPQLQGQILTAHAVAVDDDRGLAAERFERRLARGQHVGGPRQAIGERRLGKRLHA
jgi:hypothetical protein